MKFILCITAFLAFFSCGIFKNDSLYKANADFFPIGAAVEPDQLTGPEAEILIKHYNSITAENAMKYLSTEPEEGRFDFTQADKIMAFADKHGKLVRGHCLIWDHPTQIADWMFQDKNGKPASRELMLERMRNHIHKVVGQYKGKIYAWDVINEPIDTSTNDQLRHSKWYELIGPDYIEKAFIYAHEADPDAKLFINEFNTFEPEKNKAYFRLIKSLIDKKIPIHGIGLQMHIKLQYPSVSMIEQAVFNLEVFGLDLHITEMDMSFYEDEYGEFTAPSEEYLVYQAHRYKEIMDVFKKHSAAIKNVTFWGFHDGHTWLTSYPVKRKDWPLLFTDKLQPKWAFYALTDPSKLPPKKDLPRKEASTYKAKKGTPVIDGSIDKIWDKAEAAATNIYLTNYKGATASIKTLWDENKLYVLADVTDPKLSAKATEPYMQDSLEFFIDENNAKAGGYQDEDFQFRISFENRKTVGGGHAQPEMIQSKAVRTKKGYLIEASFTFQTIKGSAGTKIGYELQINDDADGSGIRKSVTKWNDPTNDSYKNTKGWGVLEMVE
jgi:endo-1,4-beta-xylanase